MPTFQGPFTIGEQLRNATRVQYDQIVMVNPNLENPTIIGDPSINGTYWDFDPVTGQIVLTAAPDTAGGPAVRKGLRLVGAANGYSLLDFEPVASNVRAFGWKVGGSGALVGYVNAGGHMRMKTSLIVSGYSTGSGDNVSIDEFPEQTMFGVGSDVNAPAVTWKLADSLNALNRFLACLDKDNNYIFDIARDGRLRWGAGAFAALDMTFGRAAATVADLTGAFLSVDNGQGFAVKDTGGSRRILLSLDSSNNALITNLGAGYLRLKTKTAGEISITNAAEDEVIMLFTNTSGAAIDVGRPLNVLTGNAYRFNGTKILGAQGAAVADAAGGATVDAEARTALNDLLARLRAHGLIAT